MIMGIAGRRVWAVIMRHMYLQFRAVRNIFDIVYWPVLDILLWGFFSVWAAHGADAVAWTKAVLIIIVLWNVSYRATLEIAVNIMEEIWDRNMVNLFVSPLSFLEWMIGLAGVGTFRAAFSLSVGSVAIFLLYGIGIWQLGFVLIPVIGLLLLSGWAYGVVTASIVLAMGKNAQSIPWMIANILAPFCGVRFPVSVLPTAVQKFSYVLPMTYVFEAVRTYVMTGVMPYSHLWMSGLLSIIYIAVGLIICRRTFEWVRRNGLSQLE